MLTLCKNAAHPCFILGRSHWYKLMLRRRTQGSSHVQYMLRIGFSCNTECTAVCFVHHVWLVDLVGDWI
jgi:hypothetical protein